MRKASLLRFWLATSAAVTTGILFLVTLLWHDWIEIVFGVEPDSGGGSLEWLIVGVLLIATVVLAVLARNEWYRVHTAIA